MARIIYEDQLSTTRSSLRDEDFLLGVYQGEGLSDTRHFRLSSISDFIKNDITKLPSVSYQSFGDSGTREGGDLIAIIGDHDNSSKGTKITLKDDAETIELKADDYVRVNHNLQIGDNSHEFYGILDASKLSGDRVIHLSDVGGYAPMSVNGQSADATGNISILTPLDQSLNNSGTREDGDLVAIIGDFDNSSKGTKIVIDDSFETIRLKANSYIRTNSTLQIGDTSHSFYGIINTSNLTSSRTIQFPDAGGYIPMSVNGQSANYLGNIEIEHDADLSLFNSGSMEGGDLVAVLGDYNGDANGTKITLHDFGKTIKLNADTYVSTSSDLQVGNTSHSFFGIIDSIGITENRIMKMPDKSGYVGMSVNNVPADSKGNIEVSIATSGATLNSDNDLSINNYFLDEDDLASDSSSKVASQQSIKAYVDNSTNSVPVATDEISGKVELATIEEIDEGTDAIRVITPLVLEGSALKVKVDGIEEGANVTDATNVDAAGATMNTDNDLSTNNYFLDEDDFASDSSSKVASQQSIKAYVDSSSNSVPAATDAVLGRVELATIEEIDEAIDTTRAITPAGLAGSALKTKLDTVETNADVTDADNVDTAGATMNVDTTLAGNSYFLDEDDMASDDADKVASQQSIKKYVDDLTTPVQTKIDTIEESADVTDADNVFSAGATMSASTSLFGANYFLDEDDMASDDATKVASQQSIKAYIDSNSGGTEGNGSVADASDTVAGKVELATITEIDTGTDALRAITPAGLAGSALKTKLDTVETNADVTDATNVNAAGATMNTHTTLVGNSYFLDEDDMSSDDATKVASQQSVKKYVDDASLEQAFYVKTVTKVATATSSTYTATTSDYQIICDTSGGLGFTVTLPSAVTVGAGRKYEIGKFSTGAIVTVETYSTETINGFANRTVSGNYGVAEYCSNGTNWFIPSRKN